MESLLPVFRDAFLERRAARAARRQQPVLEKRKYEHHNELKEIPIIVGFTHQSGLPANPKYFEFKPHKLTNPLFILKLEQMDVVMDSRLKAFFHTLGYELTLQEKNPDFHKRAAYIFFRVRYGEAEVSCSATSYNGQLEWFVTPRPMDCYVNHDVDSFVKCLKKYVTVKPPTLPAMENPLF